MTEPVDDDPPGDGHVRALLGDDREDDHRLLQGMEVLDVLTEPFQMKDGLVEVPRSAGLGVELDPEAVQRLSNFQVRESVVYDDIHGEAPRGGQIL